jgi:hypothetical protein
MTATRHHGAYIFEAALWFFVIPLTGVTMAVGLFRSRKAL